MKSISEKILGFFEKNGRVVETSRVEDENTVFYQAVMEDKIVARVCVSNEGIKLSDRGGHNPLLFLGNNNYAVLTDKHSSVADLLIAHGVIGYKMTMFEYATFVVSRSPSWRLIDNKHYIQKNTHKSLQGFPDKIELKKNDKLMTIMRGDNTPYVIIPKDGSSLKYFTALYLKLDLVLQELRYWDKETSFYPII